MSAETFIVTGSNGTSDYSFALQSRSGYKTRWADTGNTVSTKRFLDIDHQLKPAGSAGTDTHLATFRREEINSTTGALAVSTVGLVIKVPRDSAITAAIVSDLISYLASFLNKNVMDTFVQAATPSGDYNVTGPFNPVRA
jgi:hypothetical protein